MTQAEVFEYRLGSTTYEGYLAYPVGSGGRHPAVMVVPEYWGLNAYTRRRTEMIADLGYTALGIDLYGQGVHVRTPEEAEQRYATVMSDRSRTRRLMTEILKLGRELPHVDSRKVVCLGYCMGGTVSLELARSGADLRGVVSFHGALDTSLPAHPGTIRCPLLVCHGAADPWVPPSQVEEFHREMANAQAQVEFHSYEGALHSFTNPDSNRPETGAQYHAEADRQSWASATAFLQQVFR